MKTRCCDSIKGLFPSLVLTNASETRFDLQQYSHIPDSTHRLLACIARTIRNNRTIYTLIVKSSRRTLCLVNIENFFPRTLHSII